MNDVDTTLHTRNHWTCGPRQVDPREGHLRRASQHTFNLNYSYLFLLFLIIISLILIILNHFSIFYYFTIVLSLYYVLCQYLSLYVRISIIIIICFKFLLYHFVYFRLSDSKMSWRGTLQSSWGTPMPRSFSKAFNFVDSMAHG